MFDWVQKRQQRAERRAARYERYSRLVRRLRQRIFDYYDASEARGLKASRVLRKAIDRMLEVQPPRPVDQWGATAADRRLLARHGICWGD